MSNAENETSSQEEKHWKLLAYMAGDNNLSADMCWALQSMNEYLAQPTKTGKNQVEVIAQYDPNGLKPRVVKMSTAGQVSPGGPNDGEKPGVEDGNLDTKAGDEISLEATFEAVREDLKAVRDLEAVSNDPKTTSRQKLSAKAAPVTDDLVACRFADLSTEAMLRSFMKDHLDGDSRRHMVVLSGHGAGVSGDFLTDEDPHSSLMISRLGEILSETCKKKIGILGLDSCLMGMAEVACEVNDHVDFLVGSEGFVNNTGWPYHRVLSVLAGNGEPKDAAKGIVEKYAAFYQDYEMAGSSTQIAALDLGKLSNLTAAVKRLTGALNSAFESIKNSELDELEPTWAKTDGTRVRDAVILAHWYAQSFKSGEYADLWDFCDQLRRFLPNGEFQEEIKGVKQAVEGLVIRSCYCGPEFQHAHGIAIYFPWSALAVPPSYKKLKFAKATGWDTFLNLYLKTTRRMRRGDKGDKSQTPRRFVPDVPEVEEIEKLTSALGSKAGSHYDARSGSPYGTRSGSPHGTKSGSPHGSKILSGTLVVPANFQNVPDGYLRQDLIDPRLFTGDERAKAASATAP
ncbi:MAG: clostripain-related cysteine peptidase [Bryobacteraceae bacterium]